MFSFIHLLLFIFISFDFVINISELNTKYDSNELKTNKSLKTIAIIGGGVGGSSSAYFLNELYKTHPTQDISMDLYERSAEIGGRLATETINGKVYESGGSIIHDRNHWSQTLVQALGLSKRQQKSESDQKLCLYNGKSYDFCESQWSLWTYFKIWLRYGFDVNSLQSKVTKIIDKFQKVYNLQEFKVKFNSVEDLLEAMSPSVNNLTKITYKDYLFGLKFSKKFINELVQSIALVNYGQDVSIPAFVGCVSFAGAGAHLWSIRGGNKLLPKRLVENSNANLFLNTRVKSVTYLGPNVFEVNICDNSGKCLSKRYDSVIIATPLNQNEIQFINFTINWFENIPKRQYHRTVSTLIAGTLNKKFRGRDVLSDNVNNFFTSIGRVYPVDDSTDERTPVYKVFSQSLLTKEQLNKIFDEIQVIRIKDWLAYPKYDTISLPLPPFLLTQGLYHLNAIEFAASAIEMSLIGGKNCALLVYNQFEGKTSHVYNENVHKMSFNDEL